MSNRDPNRKPFGLMSCEEEVRVLGAEEYSDFYFDEAPFNDLAVDEDTYLIVGRRGSGKTALVQYFSFQNTIHDPLCIEVRAPEVYQEALAEISQRISESRTIAVPHLKRVWDFVIWELISSEIRHDAGNEGISQFVADNIQYLMSFFDDNDEGTAGARLEQIVDDHDLDQTKRTAVQVATHHPIIIAIDTLEQYDIGNQALMNALAALIEYAALFNQMYAPKNIHLKVFVAGEVFHHMKEAVLLNPLKSIRHPVYLLWRPKDLLRFISWRLYHHLQATGLWRDKAGRVDWGDVDDVLAKVWTPHFGHQLTNAQGKVEDTWPYVLRHTQMRPRQLIRLCNSIANRAIQDGTFPNFREKHIIDGINDAQTDLASEILNSFSAIYPNAAYIVTEGLMDIPKFFYGNELDRRAKVTASLWPPGEYSQWNFRQMVAEMGIIGRITRVGKGYKYVGTPQYVDADFAHGSTEGLMLTERDPCVVHPMFYRRLNVDSDPEKLDKGLKDIDIKACVLPFTTDRGDR